LFAAESKADELEMKRFPVLGAYELALKCSHVFNLLDARGAISVTERVSVMARIRALVIGVAKAYVEQGERVSELTKLESTKNQVFLDSITPRELTFNIHSKGDDVG
jgi:glycyl-tRNA synthetase alpha subunit